MQERAVGDKRYRNLDVIQILNKLHKVRSARGLSAFYYAPDTIFRHLVKDHLPLLCRKIRGLGESHLPFLVGIAEGTHRTVKIAVVSHAEHCHNRTPPPKCHIRTPFADEPDSAYSVDQCMTFAGVVTFKQFSCIENLNSTVTTLSQGQ